jgi:opacity protein-like surface antigen
VNAYGGDSNGIHITAQTYMFGPVASYRRSSRFTPFAQFELGLIHANTGYLGISQDANKFALAPGAGVDFRFNRQAALRIQGSYLSTYFLNSRQDNLQFSAGLVLYFGRK